MCQVEAGARWEHGLVWGRAAAPLGDSSCWQPSQNPRLGRRQLALERGASLARPELGAPRPTAELIACFKGRGHHRHRVTCAGVATAKASPPCIRSRHGHHAKACPAVRTDTAQNKSDAAQPAASSGAYQIQVGVFSTPTEAKAHMASLRGRFHKVLTAAPQVEKAGHGKYRARFAGFDHDDARQACHTLVSKGVHCMVVAGS